MTQPSPIGATRRVAQCRSPALAGPPQTAPWAPRRRSGIPAATPFSLTVGAGPGARPRTTADDAATPSPNAPALTDAPPAPPVSVICTVLNEANNIADMLLSLLAQTRLPQEIVIVDAGSRDDTVGVIERLARQILFPVRVLVKPGANRSAGRNIAIREADGPLIAATDAGCRAEPQWLERLVAPLESGEAQVAAGFYQPDCDSPFEEVVAALCFPALEKINPDTFLPSSRSVAFLKQAWQAVGGYPEEYAYAEDTWFDLKLRRAGFRFRFVPEALVRWRMQTSLRAVYRQFRAYAGGDARAGLFWRHYWKVPLGLALLLVLSLASSFAWGLPLTAAVTLLYYLAKGLKVTLLTRHGLYSLLVGMLVAATTDLGNFVGFTKGLWARRRERKAQQKPEPPGQG